MKNTAYCLSGDKCKARRTTLGLTQSAAAERAGIAVQHYNRFEQRRSNPTLDTAARIAAALLCHVDDLIG